MTVYKRRLLRIGILPLIIGLVPGVSVSAEDLQVSVNRWMSEGHTKWRHDAQSLLYGRPSSELDYQGVDSEVTEVGMRIQLASGHGLQFTVGTGDISEGLLVDDDYVSAYGATYYGATQSGEHRFSRTHSDIDGTGLFYLSATFAPRELQVVTALVDLHFNLTYQYWQEEYTADGIRQIECTILSHPDLNCAPAGTVYYTGVTVITNRVEWRGLGLMLDGLFNLSTNLQVKFNAVYYPVMNLNNEDTHHLRTDLAQNPSVRMTGSGSGYDVQLGLLWQIENNFSLHLSHRIWERSVEDQVITFYGAGGGAGSADLMNFKTRREGWMLGFNLSL